jgi:uncharacterized protein (TIGR03067 family)
VRICDPASGQEILALEGPPTEVLRIAFDRSDLRLIVISDAATVTTWQVADAGHDDLSQLQGRWRLVELQADGEQAPAEIVATLKFVFKGRTLTMTPGEPGFTNFRVSVDPAATPARFDEVHADGTHQGSVRRGIYRFDNGRLTICLPFGADRPTEFSAQADSRQVLYVLEREGP